MARARTEPPAGEAERSSAASNGGETPPDTPETAERLSAPNAADPEAVARDVTEFRLPEPRLPMIHAAMVAILGELPAIGKTSRNEQQGFMFRSHDDVLNAINPLLAKHGVYVVPNVLERLTDKRSTARNSIMYEVNLHVRYRFFAADGSWVDCSTWGEGTDMGDKATNKAMTMAFKNALAQAFAVSVEKNPDADRETPEETVAAGGQQDPTARAKQLRDAITKLLVKLDAQTKSGPGTWFKLVTEGSVAAFKVGYDELDPDQLIEVGKTLAAHVENGTSSAPDQLDLTVPF